MLLLEQPRLCQVYWRWDQKILSKLKLILLSSSNIYCFSSGIRQPTLVLCIKLKKKKKITLEDNYEICGNFGFHPNTKTQGGLDPRSCQILPCHWYRDLCFWQFLSTTSLIPLVQASNSSATSGWVTIWGFTSSSHYCFVGSRDSTNTMSRLLPDVICT